MKNFITLLAVLGLILSSCNSRPSNEELARTKKLLKEQAILDSMTEVEKARKDSIILVEQNKAIGDIMFGMTKDQFKKSYDNFKKKCEVLKYTFDDGVMAP